MSSPERSDLNLSAQLHNTVHPIRLYSKRTRLTASALGDADIHLGVHLVDSGDPPRMTTVHGDVAGLVLGPAVERQPPTPGSSSSWHARGRPKLRGGYTRCRTRTNGRGSWPTRKHPTKKYPTRSRRRKGKPTCQWAGQHWMRWRK